jgi:hypothetical protein
MTWLVQSTTGTWHVCLHKDLPYSQPEMTRELWTWVDWGRDKEAGPYAMCKCGNKVKQAAAKRVRNLQRFTKGCEECGKPHNRLCSYCKVILGL